MVRELRGRGFYPLAEPDGMLDPATRSRVEDPATRAMEKGPAARGRGEALRGGAPCRRGQQRAFGARLFLTARDGDVPCIAAWRRGQQRAVGARPFPAARHGDGPCSAR
jgi:hypothetical protein